MPPFIKNTVSDLPDDVPDLEPITDLKQVNGTEEEKPYKLQIVWRNVVLMLSLHIAAVYGFVLFFTSAKWQTAVAGK